MAINLQETDGGRTVEIRISGKLVKEDYHHFVPEVDRLVHEHGKLRMLVEMGELQGWTTGALWEDLKFDVKHFSDIERVAMVGEKKWQERMAHFCRPFTAAKVRYFDHSQIESARQWLAAA